MLNRARLALLKTLPAVLFFSYHPLISLGATDSMHLELSLPLLWIFAISLLTLPRLPDLYKTSKKLLLTLSVLPCYAFLSLLWTANPLRTFLSAGVLLCLALTILSLFDVLKTVKNSAKPAFLTQTLKIFLTAAVLVSAFAWAQSLLDALGVPRSATLLCAGCTSAAFGFPHPNAFAIEPQFFGNLLLAPVLLVYASLLYNNPAKSQGKRTLLALFLTTTLFFTFSRGAIYSFLAAFAALLLFYIIKKSAKPALKLIPVVAISFLLTLLAQGFLAEISYTTDTFASGVSKSINQLTLGKITLAENPENANETPDETENPEQPTEKTEQTEQPAETEKITSTYSGYVEESTDFRLRLTDIAFDLWDDSPATVVRGLGLGGAGVKAYEKYPELGTAQQIIQNEYASLLLEFGLLGLALIVFVLFSLYKLLKFVHFTLSPPLLALLLAYALSLNFFSGLPNALHLYLLPVYAIILINKEKIHGKNRR